MKKLLLIFTIILLFSAKISAQYTCVSSFSWNQYQGNTFHFTENATTGDQNTYHWYWGDGTNQSTTSHTMSHTFPGPGSYNVCLIVYDISPNYDTLCLNYSCHTISTTSPYTCNASFADYLYQGFIWHFYANGTGNQNWYHWDFGDGTFLDAATLNPSHTYPGNGVYQVCLTVYDITTSTHDTLCAATSCDTITIGTAATCVSSFAYYQYQGNTWHFYENAQTGDQNQYHWYFGDGTTLDTAYTGAYNLASHTFPGPGTYHVCLSVFDIDSNTHDTLCAMYSCNYITIPTVATCVASFGYYQYNGYTWHFYENATTGDQNNYHWIFGDGTTLNTTSHSASHTYPGPGTYNACLVVYDINSTTHDTLCVNYTCHSITITATSNCVASFSYAQYNGYTWNFTENATTGDQNSYHWTFGDGTSLNTTSHTTSHTYTGPGSYNVCLIVYDINSTTHDTLCHAYTCHSIAFTNLVNCVASFAGYFYQGYTWHWYENAQTGDQNWYHWDFGDGTTLDTTYTLAYNMVSHTFPGNGSYYVCLTVYDINTQTQDTLCTATLCNTVTLNTLATCVSTFVDYLYQGNTWHFYSNPGTGNQNWYHWDFDDGTHLDTITSYAPFHTFPGNGVYHVCLTTYDITPTTHDTICSTTSCDTIVIGTVANCVATFVDYLYQGFTWHFYTSPGTGNQNWYHWDFGDGTVMDTASINPFHTYPGNGVYYPCLTAYDINPTTHDTLCSATTCDTITIGTVYNCVASFGYYQYNGYDYHFYENATTGDQNTYHWIFGDGTTLDTTAVFFGHTFPGNGTYNVCLVVYDINPTTHDTLCVNYTCQTITIGNTCVASFAYYFYQGSTIHFVENATTGDQNSYHWIFGDGTTLDTIGQSIIHTYPGNGTYHVCLIVYDINPQTHDTLCANYTCHYITIGSTCEASFAFYQYQGNIWHFYVNAQTGDQNWYHWDFGDGTTLDTAYLYPFHTFPGNGIYHICLTVFDIDPQSHDTLCSDTLCQVISIGTSNCIASFGYYLYYANTIHFYENATTGDQNTYHWIFGDGTTLDTTAHSVIHTYPGNGTYTVCLVVYDIDPIHHDTLCVDYTCQTITIGNACLASFGYYQYQGNMWHFYVNAPNGDQNWYHWDFGDGTTLDTAYLYPFHTFPGPGTYNVCLTAYDIDPQTHDTLCYDAICHHITIGTNNNCVASFAWNVYYGNTIHFYENAQTGSQNTFLWDFGDEEYVLTNSHYAYHDYASDGSYYVCLTVLNIDTINYDTICTAIMCQTVGVYAGIEEQEMSTDFNLYPNPATDNVTLECLSLNKDAELTIYNIQGRSLLKQKLIQEKTNIDISSLAKGIYFVKIESEGGITVRKFIKD